MPSISAMEMKVHEAERINAQLRSELYELESGIDSARNKWNQLSQHILSTLINGNDRLGQSQDLAVRAKAIEAEIEQKYKLFKNMEYSNKMIRECQNRIYYEFADYTRVRKIVDGLLNNLEVKFVSDAALVKAIEVQHLKLPDYWLTCAMLALMAWRNDDSPMAEKALERACMLDQKATSIFFFAMYLRMGRYPAALKWFESYTACERTGNDNQNILFMFSILTKNAGEITDDKVYQSIEAFVHQLVEERVASDGYHPDEMIRRIQNAYGAMILNEPFSYPLLEKHCSDSSVMNGTLLFAKNNLKILEFIRQTVNVTAAQKRNRINAFIDSVIRRANTTEVSVRNEIRYHETVIRYLGDAEAAKEDHDAWLVHNQTELDIIGEMVNWLYYPGDEDISPDERERFFIITKDLSRGAVDAYAENYHKFVKDVHPITIGDYSSDANLRNSGSEDGKIESFFHEREQAQLAQVKVWPAYVWFGAAALGIVGAAALGTPALLAVTAAGILGGAAKILLTKREKAEIVRQCGADISATQRSFREIQEEYTAYMAKYEEYNGVLNDIYAEFDKL